MKTDLYAVSGSSPTSPTSPTSLSDLSLEDLTRVLLAEVHTVPANCDELELASLQELCRRSRLRPGKSILIDISAISEPDSPVTAFQFLNGVCRFGNKIGGEFVELPEEILEAVLD